MNIYLLGSIASIITCVVISLLVLLGLLVIIYYLQTNKEKIKFIKNLKKKMKGENK